MEYLIRMEAQWLQAFVFVLPCAKLCSREPWSVSWVEATCDSLGPAGRARLVPFDELDRSELFHSEVHGHVTMSP